ncbi:YfmQ family protein [Niallia sp. 03133]|uniref:YfmQ family protein n=1 Tax=Niallia sp. 03133 TaxID=3458060 RepID=UPI0040441960
MTWTVLIVTTIICIIKISMTCLPTGVVEWLIRKFEMHSKLSEANTTVTIAGKHLEGADKLQVIHLFNEASVLEKYTIFKGYNEHVYLNPENGGTPIVINTKKGKKEVKLLVFSYSDHVDIVKQYKKKVVAYSVHSDSLQKRSMLAAGNLV